MSEKNLQKALVYLYSNIDRLGTDSDAVFERFPLSRSEKQSLEELMTSQRDRLLLFNQQLHHKRMRSIRIALPRSGEIAGRELESLLEAYATCPAPEGVRQPACEVRAFANYVGAQIGRRTGATREWEIIRFEAVFAAVSLSIPSGDFRAPRVDPLPEALRLSRAGDAALITCAYNVLALMEDPSLIGTSDLLSSESRFFIFQAGRSVLRVLKVAPKLAGILNLFENGWSLGTVLETLAGPNERAAASAAIENLVRSGAPFYCSAEPGATSDERSNERPVRTII
jgi:hypothetical protein